MFADANQLVRDINPFVLPPSRVGIQYAAENYMMLKGGGGLAPWKKNKTPYMLEPMSCMTSRIYNSVAFMGPARTGKTEALLKAQVAHAVKCNPSDIMIVHMNQNESEYFSKTEIEMMLKASKELKGCMSPISRDNNVGMIRLKAGNVIKMAWPTDATFRGKSFKYILLTDYDAIRPPGEGDVFTLSRIRTKSYQSSGMVLAESSPGHEVTDRAWIQKHPHEAPPAPGIASLYMAGDRRRFYWQCPECGEYFIPEFEHLRFDREATDPVKEMSGVFMGCPSSGCVIREKLKNQLNQSGVWLKWGQKIDQNGKVTGNALSSATASFWLPGPVAAFSKWGADFVEKYINAKNAISLTNDDRGMQAFVNTDCGWPYVKERDDDLEIEFLEDNKSELELGVVPEKAKFLLASVDVQGGKHRRFVCQIHAICDDKIQYIVDRFDITQIDGKPIKPNLNHLHWNELNRLILDRWLPVENDLGFMQPVMMGFDTNGEAGVTDRAYEYYKANVRKYGARLFPISGSSTSQTELVTKFKPEEVKNKTLKGRKRGKVPLFVLNQNKIKDVVNANMQVEPGLPLSMLYSYELEPEFFAELMAEERSESGKWLKLGGANEAFDLCVYIWAILAYKKWVGQTKFNNSVFARFYRKELPEIKTNDEPQTAESPIRKAATKVTRRRRRR